VLRDVRDRIRASGGRRERDVNRLGGGMDAFITSSDCNLLNDLTIIEGNVGLDVRTTALAFNLPPRRGVLVDVSVT
jgi:hypothetical protein